ncbi:inositol oxygenase 1 [Aureobasidium pullulans]|uniref:Inositol oxygenase n=1 Tax=Aureobasidium pullulans TaxID=5580 RepID=A0A4V4J6K1_AURPU|nr:inositol oxygenase 1 [Aureobasidium pullulans]
MATAILYPGVNHFEATSDNIDLINTLGGEKPDAPDIYQQSEFDKEKDTTTFRQFEDACDRVKSFYAQQHTLQTVAYNMKARDDFYSKTRAEMTVWEALEKLDTFVDECDPDTQESQLTHLLQTAEALRQDGKPRWMQLVGLIHDLGKLLFFYGANGQWDVVGDTFPVGCAFDEKIIFGTKSFKNNEDYNNEVYKTKLGIYSEGCGLDNVMLSWGHDEYLYHVVKDQSTIPAEGLAMIRYHSFYPWHREGAYNEFMNEKDVAMLKAVRAFNPYDLYSKSEAPPDAQSLKVSQSVFDTFRADDLTKRFQPYYSKLIDEYFPNPVVRW